MTTPPERYLLPMSFPWDDWSEFWFQKIGLVGYYFGQLEWIPAPFLRRLAGAPMNCIERRAIVAGRHAAVALALAACAGAAAAAEAQASAPAPQVIKVGVFAMAPYVVVGPQGTSGVLVDFFDREIAPRMGVRFQWERPMTMPRLESSLVSGSVQFTPILARTPARDKAGILFAGGGHIRLDPVIAVLPGHPLQVINHPADLTGISVGWVQSGALPTFMLDKRIRLERVGSVDWTSANLEKLKLRRIGAAYFSNPYTPQFFAERTGTPLRLVGLPTRGVTLYGAFSPRTPAALTARYEAAAAQAFANDRFSTYMHKAVVAQVLQYPPKTEPK